MERKRKEPGDEKSKKCLSLMKKEELRRIRSTWSALLKEKESPNLHLEMLQKDMFNNHHGFWVFIVPLTMKMMVVLLRIICYRQGRVCLVFAQECKNIFTSVQA